MSYFIYYFIYHFSSTLLLLMIMFAKYLKLLLTMTVSNFMIIGLHYDQFKVPFTNTSQYYPQSIVISEI